MLLEAIPCVWLGRQLVASFGLPNFLTQQSLWNLSLRMPLEQGSLLDEL